MSFTCINWNLLILWENPLFKINMVVFFSLLKGCWFWMLLGWTCQCPVFNPINIYWCKICNKWGLATQDWWLLSVSWNFLKLKNCLCRRFCFGHVTAFRINTCDYQICRPYRCLLDWIFYKQTSTQRLC